MSISTNTIVLCAFGIIFLGLVFAYCVKFWNKVNKYCSSISSLLDRLKTYDNRTYSIMYENISKTLYFNEYTKEAWGEYSKTLVPYQEEIENDFGTDVNTIMYSTEAVSDYFSVSTLAKNINIVFWQNLGGIFTGVGIFGTFVGLTIGLNSPELSSDQVEVLKLGIRQLLGGVGTAFITSLIGVLFAIAFNFFHNYKVNELYAQTNELISFVEGMYTRKISEEWLADVVKNSQQQTAAIKNLSTDFAAKFGETMQQGMDNSFKVLMESLEPLFEDLRDGIEKMGDGGAKAVGETISNSVGDELQGFAKAIGDIQKSLSDNMERSQKLADETNTKFANLAQEFADKITESSAGAITAQNKQMNDTMDKMKNLMEDMQKTTREASEKFQEAINATTDKQKDSLNDTCEQIKNVLTEVNQNIKIATEKMIEASTVANAALVNSVGVLDSKAQDMVKTFATKSQEQADVMGTASENMKKNLEVAVEKMHAMLDHHDEVMKSTYGKFEDGFIAAKEVISKTTNVAFDIGNSVLPIKEAAISLKTQMNETVKATSDFTRLVGDKTDEVISAASMNEKNLEKILEMAKQTKAEWTSYSDHFNKVSGEMKNSFDVLVKGTKDYNDAVSSGLEEVIRKYDKSVKEVLDRIDSEVSAMNEGIEELNDLINKNFKNQVNRRY